LYALYRKSHIYYRSNRPH
jgi:nitroreductase